MRICAFFEVIMIYKTYFFKLIYSTLQIWKISWKLWIMDEPFFAMRFHRETFSNNEQGKETFSKIFEQEW